ncbi:hypothetical protein [Nostoc sp. CHAB 5715]|uniref:hypothetical protein n=1 Tax=Nostoc sp. CHAB 5715 TaxID=2780400 RepID=UPI001E2A46BA|nr:hypothetical protein [Nostoc sp. CHAB 5715]MCC5620535.1 hypothetical protein [Nostoc sp. CHAB 5715]
MAPAKRKHTTNLQIPINEDVTVGGRTFKAGTLLNTGLDVPANSLVPLGMRASFTKGKLRFGITCALCHATLDNKTGRILEGAPNNDVNKAADALTMQADALTRPPTH